MAGLGAEERARDRRCSKDCAGTGSQARQRPLLLGQGIRGQLEAELLDRFSHATVLQIA
jgi:hypothetical protein